MKTYWFVLWMCLLPTAYAGAQCKVALDEIDPFDSLRTVVSQSVTIGNRVPSKFETADGPKLIEEAKVLFTYTEKDSIRSFFLVLGIQEWEYHRIDSDYNVLLMLDDGQVIELMNFSDQGTFDAQTNMRLYQHTCLIPIDLFYALTHFKVQKIRINYRTEKRTVEVQPGQQTALRNAVRCVGERIGMSPLKP
jgi:hypothetical protein